LVFWTVLLTKKFSSNSRSSLLNIFAEIPFIPQSIETQPIIRTYTHSGIDLEKNEIWIDFIAHGDEGPASAWALNAVKGDVLGVLMKDGKTDLYLNADNYILIADATGIPVIAAILKDLPITASGVCILEVHGKEDEQLLSTNADINFIWLHNKNPQKGSLLTETIKKQILPEFSKFAYVAAEFTTVKNIRNYLRKESNWQQKELYAYSYWKAGVSEDKSVSDRHKEMETN